VNVIIHLRALIFRSSGRIITMTIVHCRSLKLLTFEVPVCIFVLIVPAAGCLSPRCAVILGQCGWVQWFGTFDSRLAVNYRTFGSDRRKLVDNAAMRQWRHSICLTNIQAVKLWSVVWPCMMLL